MCRIGRDDLCDNLEFFGCGYREGGMADIFSVPAGQLYKVPGRLTPEQVALIEPLASPLHAVRLTGDLRGKAVAVFGAGTIGLLTLLAAKRAGAGRVVCTDLLASKRRLALDLGADAVVGSGDDGVAEAVRDELGESGDAVFDCVATQETLADAIKLAATGGTRRSGAALGRGADGKGWQGPGDCLAAATGVRGAALRRRAGPDVERGRQYHRPR